MMIRKLFGTCAALAAAALLLDAPVHAAPSAYSGLNLPRGVTVLSRQIYGLHMMIFWVCVAIGIIVFGIIIYSLIVFRKSKGAVPDTKLVHNTKVEVVWTAIPVLILIAVVIPSVRVVLHMNDLSDSQLRVKVTGFQWGWQYDYLDYGVKFFSRLDRRSDAARQLDSGISPFTIPHYLRNVNHPMVVPVGTKVLLLITSKDVIHSWWVPDLGVKKDAIPGFINTYWFKVDPTKPGTYRGQCAELCGRDHAFMPIVVKAVSKSDFQAWITQQQAARQATKQAAAVGPAPVTTG